MGIVGLLAAFAAIPRASADDLARPTPIPSMVQPAQYREIPTNTRLLLVTTSSADAVQAAWPNALPRQAPPGWTAVMLNHQNGTRVATTITKWPVPGGTMIQIAPDAPLDPETQYDILAAVAERDPRRPASGDPVAVQTKFVARIITGAGPDTEAPAWPGPGQVSLRTVVGAEGRYGCQAYLEEISFNAEGLADEGTVPRNLRIRVDPATELQTPRRRPAIGVTPKTDLGLLRVSSCDGATVPWTGRPGQAVGSYERVMHVFAEDLAGNRTPTFEVRFATHQGNQPEWTTEGQVRALDAPAAPAAEDEATADEEATEEAHEDGGTSPVALVIALVLLGGIVVFAVKRKRG